MVAQCGQCLRIRVEGMFRLPWPGEIGGEQIEEVYCVRCARERLARVRAGEYAMVAYVGRRAANS